MNRFFKIPAGAIIEPDVNAADLYIKHDLVRAWYREVREIDGQMTPVVVLQRMDFDVPTDAALVRDGEWSQQLESCVGGCLGGNDPIVVEGGEVRTAYGGMLQTDPFGYTEIQFPAADEWVILDGSKLSMVGYGPDGTDEYDYNLVENSMTLRWTTPVPLTNSYTAATVVWSVAATGNDQTYAFTWVVDGAVGQPQGQTYLIRERGGDVETLVQQGHRRTPDGTKIQLAVKNVGGTNPLRLYGLNWRMVSSNQNELI